MNCTVWPFWSQQDKRTGEFLRTCGNVKLAAWLARRIEEELGWTVEGVVPYGVDFPFKFPVPVGLEPDNRLQKYDWPMKRLRRVLKDVDILVTSHEFLAIPARALFPNLKIVQMLVVDPKPIGVFKEAWDSADLVVAQGPTAAQFVRRHTQTPVSAWPMAYDRDIVEPLDCVRDVDVLFVLRCSASNYTHHEEFLQAVEGTGLRVAFTDVTGYLRKLRPDLEYSTPDTYIQYLNRSKTVFAANDNLYGGMALREACACGCVPVVLDALCYRDFLGEGWPYFTNIDPKEMREKLLLAVQEQHGKDKAVAAAWIESYQEGWKKAKEDLWALTNGG